MKASFGEKVYIFLKSKFIHHLVCLLNTGVQFADGFVVTFESNMWIDGVVDIMRYNNFDLIFDYLVLDIREFVPIV